MNAPHERTGALKAALEYGKRGWPVFQTFIKDGKLLPASAAKDGGPRWDATTDPKEIKRRWTIKPNAGVAIATGRTAGILVVDIDTIKGHGEDGYASLAELEACNGLIPDTLSVTTPSGGRHLYFKYPAGCNIGNGASKIARGIDHRGDGGYVNAVPSVRPDGAYSWECPIGLFEPADCPDWLLNLMEKKPPPTLSERAMPLSPLKMTTASRWAAALTAEVTAVWGAPEGKRNDQLNASAFNLGQIVAGGGLDRATVEQELTAAAKNAGLGNSETIATIKSGLEAGMLEPRRTFEELVAAAKELTNGDMGEVEAVTIEAAALTPIQRNQVFREIKQATKIPIGTLKEQIRGEINDDPDHLDLANVTLDKIGRENIICTSAFVWRWSDCGVWKQQNDRAVKQEVQAVINDQTVKVTSSQVYGVTDVLKSEIFSSDHEFNQGNPESVNCENGELELDRMNWVLRPHCREHYRTTQIPVTYDPQAKAPRFQEFLEQIFRDDPDQLDKIASVLELMGYSLMSHAQHERFVMLIGPGANGKSVLLAVLEALLGAKNVAGVQPANFDNRFQRAHLHQKLANIVTELKQGEVIADAALKAITSGEPATVEHKHKDPFVIRPFSTCWFGTNHMPRTRDFSEALFRRATILTFNRTFTSWEQDTNLKETLIKELPGILNMCLDAYSFALIIDFAKPQSSDAAKTEWRLEADQVAQFVEDCCVAQSEARAKVGDVFNAYIFWAAVNGIKKTMAQKGFRDRLTRLGFGTDRDRANRYVTGLTLTDQPWNG